MSYQQVKITGTTLERDIHSKALTEKDFTKAEAYKVKRAQIKMAARQEDRINKLEHEVTALRRLVMSLITDENHD